MPEVFTSAPRPIARPSADEHAAGTAAYIDLVPGGDARPVLLAQVDELMRLADLSEGRALHRYASGKWSVKEVVGHLTDAERVYGYRALRFARADATPLSGFDEDLYVPAGRFDRHPIADLVAAWCAVRASTLALYQGLDDEALLGRGLANGYPVSVRALAWLAAGHTRHHLAVLRARYGIA